MKCSAVMLVLVGFMFSVNAGCGGMVVEEDEIGQNNQAAYGSEYYQAMLADLELEFDLDLLQDEYPGGGAVPAKEKCLSECVKIYDACERKCGISEDCRTRCFATYMNCASSAKQC